MNTKTKDIHFGPYQYLINEADSSFKDTIEAYSDKSPNLNFRSSKWMSFLNWMNCMDQALEKTTYNEFNVMNFGFLKMYSGLKYQPAREHSVCVYVRGFRDAEMLKHFAGKMVRKGKADEIGNNQIGHDISNMSLEELDEKFDTSMEIRVWWD